MAGPVFNNTIDIIANISWPKIKGEELAVEFNIKKFIFLNDFVINGYGLLSNIKEGEDYIKLNDKKVDPNGPIVMIGAGTGLGHGYIVKGPNDKYYNVYPSEGGHQDFCPQTERHWRYHEYLKQFYKIDHVSIERACAGPVIPVMFKYFVEVEKMTEKSPLYDKVEEIDFLKPEVIVKAGIDGSCNISVKVLEFFSELYGAAAGNMSLLLLPTGGVYLLGSLSVSLEQYTKSQEVFTQSYCNKGRLRPLLQEIPLYLVKNTFIGMKGAHVRIF